MSSAVATEEFLEGWNIALIVVGLVVLAVEAATSSVLAVMLIARSTAKFGKLAQLCPAEPG